MLKVGAEEVDPVPITGVPLVATTTPTVSPRVQAPVPPLSVISPAVTVDAHTVSPMVTVAVALIGTSPCVITISGLAVFVATPIQAVAVVGQSFTV